MLDQDTALALVTLADEAGARLALVGDRHQLSAVGRGGVLDLAADTMTELRPEGACLRLETVHRSPTLTTPTSPCVCVPGKTPPRYSTPSWPAATSRSIPATPNVSTTSSTSITTASAAATPCPIRRWSSPTPASRSPRSTPPSATTGTHRRPDGGPGPRSRPPRGSGSVSATPSPPAATTARLGVTNRETWTVTALGEDGSMTITHPPAAPPGVGADARGVPGGTQAGAQGGTQASVQVSRGERTLPAAYVQRHVELAYARTVYGAQGETVDAAHFVLGENTGAASRLRRHDPRPERQHRAPGRRERRRRTGAVGRGLRPRPRRPRTRPRSRPCGRGPRPLRQPRLGDLRGTRLTNGSARGRRRPEDLDLPAMAPEPVRSGRSR